MEKVLLEQRSRREILDFILTSGTRAREKLTEAERLLSTVKSRVEHEPVLKGFLGNFIDSLRVPEPPLPSSAEEMGRKLEDFEKQLDELITQLRSILETVENIGKLAPLARELEGKLNSWVSILRDINPPLYSEVARCASRLSRAMRGLVGLDPEKAYEVLSDLVKEGERLEVKARAEYVKAVKLMLGELESTRGLVQKALRVVMPHERLELEEWEKKLLEISEKLSAAKQAPVPLNPPQIYAELSKARKLAAEKLEKALNPLESGVLHAYSRLASSSEARLFTLHELVELVSRGAEASLPDTLLALYELSRKGLIRLFAKLS